jgi:hypothetical protein
MNTYLLAIGWWNFAGSIMMLGFLYQPFGQKMLNEWISMFKDKFVLDYWGKLWFVWAAGLNIFFGLVNIMAVKWGYTDVQTFLIWFDIIAYLIFVGLVIWGLKVGRLLRSGAYSAFFIFSIWIIWGYWVVR